MYLTRVGIKHFSRRSVYTFSAQNQILWQNFSDIQKNIIDLTNNHKTLSDQYNSLSYSHDLLNDKCMELQKDVNKKVEFIERFQYNTNQLKTEIDTLEDTKSNLEAKYKREINNFNIQRTALEGSDISVVKAKEILDDLEYMKKQEKEKYDKAIKEIQKQIDKRHRKKNSIQDKINKL